MKHFSIIKKSNEGEGQKMKKSYSKRFLSVFLCIALIMTYLPILTAAAISDSNIVRVSDPSTMDDWKDFFLPNGTISTNNAGRVWMDKSVFTDAEDFTNTSISLNDENAFLVALSAMATNMTVTGMSHVPTDTMLILDVSASMGPGQNNVASELIEAANTSIASLLNTNPNSRVGVVLYSGPTTQGGSATSTDAVLILPLGRYDTQNDIYLNLSSNNRVSLNSNVVYENTNTRPSSTNKSVTGGTYIQKGIILAANQLTAEDHETTVNDSILGTINRKPVMVLMSDGSPTFSSTNFQNPTSINLGDGTATSAAQGFVTQLSAAYAKQQIEAKYNSDCLFYTIGIGISNDAVATSVLDPNNANASVAVNDFWETWDAAAVGGTVTVQSGGRFSSAKTVTKIDGLEKNYADDYIHVEEDDESGLTLGEKLKYAFEHIVSTISLQSRYAPTLISSVGENHSGFITFVDKIGEYMEVTEIKGILINDKLYSGADLASNFVAGGGNLGTYDNPTELGREMVSAVRERIGLANDDEARTLIGLAYENGQIAYNNANDFSNYIGWYADENSNFLGFYHEGLTEITDPDAVYTIKSYGYLGVEHDSNMMYATVQVRHNIKTGENTVAFAIPAALIPVMTYEVALNSENDLTSVKTSGDEHPIRLVYEVALDDKINEWNLKEVVSAEYLAENTNADGTVNFYTNDWEHSNSTGYNSVNTYSYFNPSRQNDRYYYTQDTPIYADTNGTLYNSTSAPNADGTFYRAYTIYEKDGNELSKKTVYRQLSSAVIETALQANGTNNWYIPTGNVRVNLSGYIIDKSENITSTLSVANQPFVDTHNHSVGDAGYNFYVGATLGNNGKLTITTETGIKLSKVMADGSTVSDKPFIFDLFNESNPYDGRIYPARLISADGTESEISVCFDDGNATVELNAGDILYIGGMKEDNVFRIVERESVEYIATATGLDENGTVTIISGTLAPVNFVNSDRGTGDLTISKVITHPFGPDYQIPDTLEDFEITVTLSGIGTANAEFTISRTEITQDFAKIQTDENGQFTVNLNHNELITIFGLPIGTLARVEETKTGTGFTPTYWNDGEKSDEAYGEVEVTLNSTASVIIENTYEPEKVSDVNIELTGKKSILDAANGNSLLDITQWDNDYIFEIILQRYNDETNEWEDVGETVKVSKTNGDTFAFDMSGEEYAKPGIYAYQVYEIEPVDRVDGIIYDPVWHTFSVYVDDTDMNGELEIVRVHSEHANKDFELNAGGNYEVINNFTNIKTASVPALVTVDIVKNLINNSNSDRANLAGYNFGLYTDENCTVPATNTDFDNDGTDDIVIDRVATDSAGEGWIDVTFNEVAFENSDHYVFYVKEIDNGINGMTYSTKIVKVEIDLTKTTLNNGAIANIVAEKVTFSDELTFTNTYSPTEAELAIDFVGKELSGRDMVANEFTFEVQTIDGSTVLRGTNNAQGKVIFNGNLEFDKVGTYHYDIVETSIDGNGVTTDKTMYRIAVTVIDADGQLTASYVIVNATGNSIVFNNAYEAADTVFAISGTKVLTGRVLMNDEFTFLLTEALNPDGDIAEGAKTYETRNRRDGGFTFPKITYTEAGTYYYVVTEKQSGGSNYGIKYDTTEYVVTVTVKDNTQLGRLEASANLGAEDIKFNNVYQAAPISQSIPGNKMLRGKTLVLGQFRFQLWQSDNDWTYADEEPLQTVTNDANGNFAFNFVDYLNDNAAEFTKTGTYYYLINEANGGGTINGITYDATVYRVRVDITDNLLGQLIATVHIYDNEGIPQESIVFENLYEADNVTVSVTGTKVLENRTLAENEFKFFLYPADENYVIDTQAEASETRNNADGSFTFDAITFEEAGTYYFVITEDAETTAERVTNDTSVYRMAIEIKDDENGKLYEANRVITKAGSDQETAGIVFTNVFTPKPEDITVDITVTKTVVNKGSEQIGPEGFEFVLENLRTQEKRIIETDENGNASFTLGYTENDVGNTYTYRLSETDDGRENVQYSTTEYNITVTVALNENNGLITTLTCNGEDTAAIVAEFENIYDYTPELPDNPDIPDTPDTGDTTNLHLWFALLFVSGIGIFGAALYGKKKKEENT